MRVHPLYQIKNTSTVLTDADIEAALPAFKYAADHWFEPWWNGTGSFIMQPNPVIGRNMRTVEILDTSDQAGALGYHYDDNGNSILRIFAKTDKQYGYDWRVTFTHELWEDLGDPTCIFAANDTSDETVFRALELGDPVEADNLAMRYNNVPISDFVLPAWFTGDPSPYDYARKCTQPLQVLQGGYVSIFENGKWTSYQQQHGTLVPTEADDDPKQPRIRNRNKRREHLSKLRAC